MIRQECCNDEQSKARFVLAKPDNIGVYGTADDCRGDCSVLKIQHLELDKLINYLEKFKLNDADLRTKQKT